MPGSVTIDHFGCPSRSRWTFLFNLHSDSQSVWEDAACNHLSLYISSEFPFSETIKTSSASGSQDSIANPRSGSRMHGVGGVGSSIRICNFLQFQPFSIHRRIAWKAANLL
eukprot:TRINITY_DN1163_c0_g1_i4.p2 TRINITY_DN1163_c0_g1~~TRINITY_DN1163_c0_g1_i4.p2  ORF type:complete len:111 (+),score=12.03 TRINITY_DN1163_c0_g1_i4:127-459(+)